MYTRIIKGALALMNSTVKGMRLFEKRQDRSAIMYSINDKIHKLGGSSREPVCAIKNVTRIRSDIKS